MFEADIRCSAPFVSCACERGYVLRPTRVADFSCFVSRKDRRGHTSCRRRVVRRASVSSVTNHTLLNPSRALCCLTPPSIRYFESSQQAGHVESSTSTSTSTGRKRTADNVQDYVSNTSTGTTAATADGRNGGDSTSSGVVLLSGRTSFSPTPTRSGSTLNREGSPAAVSPGAAGAAGAVAGNCRSVPVETVAAVAAAAGATEAGGWRYSLKGAAAATRRAEDACPSSLPPLNMDDDDPSKPNPAAGQPSAPTAAAAVAAAARSSASRETPQPAASASLGKKRPRVIPPNPYHSLKQQDHQRQRRREEYPAKNDAQARAGGREEQPKQMVSLLYCTTACANVRFDICVGLFARGGSCRLSAPPTSFSFLLWVKERGT